ncbi:MAG: TRAP transporter large permease [Desulfobacula sp.]|uniref:TRAP transporter large permease n=4 Tax=Desulfobacula sp. TaxID=2593537 RepID=UPI001D3380A0|nr:TRAP transporter large permease [Desulfobacula sp.]MBT4027463.1 TRAP transporter large permease [Desulfobacula sp.]MBT4197825.1 TRAP transporter large permease [Desulfobacula sp.]MBT4874293.1 TRAP transporter large permease [Desulfobacula sp.]MBT5546057.1 TRAP transporter large permease [Desulfobacula sp.]
MALLSISMIIMLLFGFPFMVVLLGSLMLYLTVYMPAFQFPILVQQVLTGVTPSAMVCIPMFILSANLITSGKSAEKLIRMVQSFVGHIPGGLPITATASCTLFGGVSGSTQATVAAIGGTMRPMLLKAGYPSSFTMGLIINASDIAYLIPPSIGFIVYGVATSTSIGKLFLAGIIPGLLILFLFSLYSYFYSKILNIGQYPKANWKERIQALKDGLPVMGFPLVIIGGIYTGIFSPTEAAAASVAYALMLEVGLYRSLTKEKIVDAFLQTGVITGVVFVLVGAGQALSWMLSFLRIPQEIMPIILGIDPSMLKVTVVVIISYFVACMFLDPIVAIYVLSPIFHPYVAAAGIDPVLLGTLVCIQVAIGSATPPFGCDIFTAQLLFRRPYFEVIAHTPPFILILLLVTALLVIFPDIALFLPNTAFIN